MIEEDKDIIDKNIITTNILGNALKEDTSDDDDEPGSGGSSSSSSAKWSVDFVAAAPSVGVGSTITFSISVLDYTNTKVDRTFQLVYPKDYCELAKDEENSTLSYSISALPSTNYIGITVSFTATQHSGAVALLVTGIAEYSGTLKINYYDGVTSYSAGNDNQPSTSITILPVTKYTVSYNSNGGSGTMSSETKQVTKGTEITLAANTFTRTGWTFIGWSLSSNATEATWTDQQKVTVTYDMPLYAVWNNLHNIEVVYNYGAAEGLDGLTKASSDITNIENTSAESGDFTISESDYDDVAWTGHDFSGWKSSDGSVTITKASFSGGEYTFTVNISNCTFDEIANTYYFTLIALWGSISSGSYTLTKLSNLIATYNGSEIKTFYETCGLSSPDFVTSVAAGKAATVLDLRYPLALLANNNLALFNSLQLQFTPSDSWITEAKYVLLSTYDSTFTGLTDTEKYAFLQFNVSDNGSETGESRTGTITITETGSQASDNALTYSITLAGYVTTEPEPEQSPGMFVSFDNASSTEKITTVSNKYFLYTILEDVEHILDFMNNYSTYYDGVKDNYSLTDLSISPSISTDTDKTMAEYLYLTSETGPGNCNWIYIKGYNNIQSLISESTTVSGKVVHTNSSNLVLSIPLSIQVTPVKEYSVKAYAAYINTTDSSYTANSVVLHIKSNIETVTTTFTSGISTDQTRNSTTAIKIDESGADIWFTFTPKGCSGKYYVNENGSGADFSTSDNTSETKINGSFTSGNAVTTDTIHVGAGNIVATLVLVPNS